MTILKMTACHVPQIAELEKLCFHDPWSENSIASELHNKLSNWLVAIDDDQVVGYVGSQTVLGETDMMNIAIHPQYRKQGIQKLFLDALMDKYLPGQEISMTTYREGDKADTGHRDILKQLGFAERELLIEFGYPTQRFVLPPKYMEDIQE